MISRRARGRFFPNQQSTDTAVDKKIEPLLRNECNVFDRLDSIESSRYAAALVVLER